MTHKRPKLLVLQGISASGKSTRAKELVEQGYVQVEKDQIRLDTRLFPDGYKYPKDEKRVVKERDRLIRQALESGKNVVNSDTNLNPAHIRQLERIAEEWAADFEVDKTFLTVPLKDLIERDKSRPNSVGEPVIRKQFHEFVKKLPTFIEWDSSLPSCIISDIDGTLTLGPKKRSPYEWEKVGNDDINLGVAYILDTTAHMNQNLDPERRTKVFLFSGRSDICRPQTEEWLERHDVEYDALYMREHERLQEKDYIIKQDIFEKYIRGKYNVLFILDDRDQVASGLWYDIYGLNILRVGDSHYSF